MKKHLLSFILLSTVTVAASAQCTETHAPSLFINATTSYVAGQSFTAPCAGNLNYVQVTANSTGTVPAGTLTIYAGDGVGTTPIHTQAFSAITVANVGDPIRINIVGAVPVTNASQYTFTAFINLDVQVDQGYTGGQAFQDTVATGVLDVAFEVDIISSTSVNELTNSSTTVFPNPATNVLNISTKEVIQSIEIYSVNGALVKTVSTKTIDISDLNNGMYILSVLTENGVSQTRFIKE